MSRTPGATGLLDVRTTAIRQDYVISTDPCAPGGPAALSRRQRYGGTTLLENCEPPACGYDRTKDITSVLGALVIIATTLGVIHTFAVFIPSAAIEYNAGYLELCLVAALTHLVFLLTTCVAFPVVEYAGHRLTALFGMIFMFVGILLDSQVFHISVLYIANILLLGVGAGLAYAAAMTLPSDLFREKLATGTIIISVAGPLGTIFYTWFCVSILDVLGFKWTKLMVSILVLFFTLAVHVFPKTRLMYATGCIPSTSNSSSKGDKATSIRECVYKVTEEEEAKNKDTECEDEQKRHCLCVCVCDLRLFSDRSFLLWATLVMAATVNFQIPYLYIVAFAESVGARISAWYITIYCIASAGARCAFVKNLDFTFVFNRTVFQGCIAFSGFMWIIMSWAETFGWILACCVLLGVVEGVLCVVTSRVAIGTIPRKWIGGAWTTCILLHAMGIFAMAIFTAVISLQTFQFFVAFISSGVMQVIVAFLVILLPNEEDEGDAAPPVTTTVNYDYSKYYSSYESKYSYSHGLSSGLGVSSYGSYNSYDVASSRAGKTDYKCECPICSKIGCIPECCKPTEISPSLLTNEC